jgi:hypothetical protein
MREALSILFGNLDEATLQAANLVIKDYPSSAISYVSAGEMLDADATRLPPQSW